MISAHASLPAAVLAGGVFLLAWYAVELAAVRLASRGLGRWPDWPWLASLLALLGAVAALVGGIVAGAWVPSDVGLTAIRWAALASWLPGYTAGMALWVAVLYGAALAKKGAGSAPEGFVPRVARLLRDEALLAAMRGLFTPLLGLYWGSWVAAAGRIAISWWFPAARNARLNERSRVECLLLRALDLVSTVVIIMTGSVWPALAARLAVYVAAMLARAIVSGLAARGSVDRNA